MATILNALPTNPRSAAKPQSLADILKTLPRGVRFAPHPEELIFDLLEKNKDHTHTILTMPVVNLNEVEPWNAMSMIKEGEDGYLLWKQDKKYPAASKICRTTERGYWKSTGKDTMIYSHEEAGPKLIGMKKNLVFHLGRAPHGKNTKWVMKEFRIEPSAFSVLPAQNPWVVVLITYSGENNGQERMDPSLLRDLSAVKEITDPMEPSGRIATTIPAPADGASGSSVPHSDIALLPRLSDVSCSHDIRIKAIKELTDLPDYASEEEQPPMKKMKTIPGLHEAALVNDSPTSVLVPDSDFSPLEILHDPNQSSSENEAYYNWFIYEADPIFEVFPSDQGQPSLNYRG